MFGRQERVEALAFGGEGEHAHGERAGRVRSGGESNLFHPSLP